MAGILGTIAGQVRLDIRQAVAAYATLRAQNQKTIYALRGSGDAFIAAGKGMTIAGAGLLYVFGKAVQAAAEFERKMDFFQAVSGTNSKEMQKLSKFTLQLAQDTIYSADQVAEGMIELGKAGVSAKKIMGGIGEAMTNLGAAGDIPLIESGQIITAVVAQFDMKARQAVKVTDLLAGAANASIADITDIGYSLKYVGGVAAAAGLSFEDTTTAISLLAKAGIRGSTAGTSLRQMIVSFPGVTGPAFDALTKLGIITEDGSNKFYDMQGNLKPLSQVFQILQKHTEDLTNKQKLMYLRQIFNNRALSAAAILTREGAAGFKEMNGEMKKVTAADVARKRLDNLSGDIEILRGNIETLLVQAGSPFQEVLRGWVQNLTKLIQKFGELDPKTQKNIIQIIALSGAALVAMGAFSIIIGTILKFIVALYRIYQAVRFVIGIVRIFFTVLSLITGGVIGGTFLAIAAAVIAVGAAFYLAYKKITPFREWVNGVARSFMNDFINPLVDGAKTVGDWFSKLPGRISSAWNSMTSAVSGAFDSVVNWFSALPGRIGGGLQTAGGAISSFVGGVVGWFASLPGRIGAFISRIPGIVADFFQQLPGRVGYALGFLLGRIVRGWINIFTFTINICRRIFTAVVNWFAQLPGRIAAFVVSMATRAVNLWNAFRNRLLTIAAAVIAGVVRFFQRLPGRIASFVTTMVARAVNLFRSMRERAVSLAQSLVDGTVRFFRELPGRVVTFIQNMVTRARNLFHNFVNAARDMATRAYNAIRDGIRGLPGMVAGIVGDIIAAFRDQITAAAGAVRDFASGMWEGFKDGIGMHSPSYFERAMWQITGTVTAETKKLAKKTLEVQKMSKKMAATSFSVGDTFGSSGYARLARDHAANQKRARTLMTASSTSPRALAKAGVTRRKGPGPSRLVQGELDLSPSGRAFIKGVAQDAYDENDYYDDSVDRMG